MTSSKKLFSKSGETLLSARKAAGILDCAPDYVSRLCREGKIEGVRHQGQWFIEPKSLARFESEREVARATRSEMLAEERRSESKAFASANSSVLERAAGRIKSSISGGPVIQACGGSPAYQRPSGWRGERFQCGVRRSRLGSGRAVSFCRPHRIPVLLDDLLFIREHLEDHCVAVRSEPRYRCGARNAAR